MPSIKALPLMRVESIHRAAAIPRKKVINVAIAEDFRDIQSGEISNSIYKYIRVNQRLSSFISGKKSLIS
ncbi:hypothetical protein QUA70_15335 [Microcoleus sp. LAD1_D5]|uniref:hypothetical protein n=1 Tax=Microcoleus sp. LAD1_D5 TaxID=2818813 RepID=UPI002FCFFD32